MNINEKKNTKMNRMKTFEQHFYKIINRIGQFFALSIIASNNATNTLLNHDESGLIFKNVNNVSSIESYKILQYTLNLTSFLNTAQLFEENAHKIIDFCEPCDKGNEMFLNGKEFCYSIFEHRTTIACVMCV